MPTAAVAVTIKFGSFTYQKFQKHSPRSTFSEDTNYNFLYISPRHHHLSVPILDWSNRLHERSTGSQIWHSTQHIADHFRDKTCHSINCTLTDEQITANTRHTINTNLRQTKWSLC